MKKRTRSARTLSRSCLSHFPLLGLAYPRVGTQRVLYLILLGTSPPAPRRRGRRVRRRRSLRWGRRATTSLPEREPRVRTAAPGTHNPLRARRVNDLPIGRRRRGTLMLGMHLASNRAISCVAMLRMFIRSFDRARRFQPLRGRKYPTGRDWRDRRSRDDHMQAGRVGAFARW